jgi:chromosome segregation protein
MRLRSLEIKGFKSFADQTVINFEKDVIGIVGPNGCGKSNIVDAIRWVLGEQKTKELRSEKMSNVIFNGTKKRKESGLASVSLTFDNTKNILPTEFGAVTVTRMLYRSGESEYRLNDVPCRLKDITNLFMDTGIGPDSYAIIALGMVDDLLSDKENSRRRLFEQAAGVSKYKIRKRETMSKLEATSADLSRIEDLLFEIENNLKTLEKQAKRAKRFFEMKAEYKELSLELAVLRLAAYKESYKTITAQIEQEEGNLSKTTAEQQKLEAQLEADKKAILDKEQALSGSQRELNQLVGNIRGLENDKKVLEQKMQFIRQGQRAFEQQIATAQSKLEQLQLEVLQYREDITLEKRIERRMEVELEDLEKKLDEARNSHGSLKTELDAFLRQQQEMERAVFELEKKKAIHQSQSENAQRDIQRALAESESRTKEADALRERSSALLLSQSEKEAKIEALRAAEQQRLQDIELAKKRLDTTNEKLAASNRLLDAQKNEYKLTKSLVESLEGFPESIKFLNKDKEWRQKAPLLSDLIYTPEAYRVAIESYLEPYLNHYVVQRAEDAAEAIKLLGSAQKGRANFFILDAFNDYAPPIPFHALGQPATELVQVDAAYRNLCSYLLGNVIITNNENIILEEDLDKDIVLLSKSGKFAQRRFSLSGGSVGLFEGKRIGRKKNMEVLKESIEALEKASNELAQEAFHCKDAIKKLQAQDNARLLQEESNALSRILQDCASAQTRLENFEAYFKEAEQKRFEAEGVLAQLHTDMGELEIRLSAKRQETQAFKEKIARADGSYRQVADRLSEASQIYNQKNVEHIRQQNKVTTLQRELSFREKQVEDTSAKLAADQQAAALAVEQAGQAEADHRQIEAKLLEGYATKREQESSLSTVEQGYYAARNAINQQEDALRVIGRKANDTQQLLGRLKDRFNEMKLELTSIGERLRAEFGIGLNDIINNEAKTDASREEMEDKVDKMKKRLDSYGEINPMAVEAYDEMKERFDTIGLQRQDILNAKESLLETIQEIEDTASAQFMDAFVKVRGHFKNVFRRLFSDEDECDILLESPEQPLESRIKITAKPKGKRPQTIDQLSGGEKTLTATALLFSLYLLKPAPFCIFDEVDAPLDDANIGKFNNIIQAFSKESQFVIVTHNKQTMAAVNAIYGVTMQEQGVSSVVAVDFERL